MSLGSLAIIKAWHEAINEVAPDRARELSAEQIEVLGPRGVGVMPGEELAGWMTRSGFSATPLRWFCGADGNVVVEQAARWEDRETGAEQSKAVIATDFRVEDGLVARVGRHENLAAALDTAGLTGSDEVSTSR